MKLIRIAPLFSLAVGLAGSCAAPQRSTETMKFLQSAAPQVDRLRADVAWLADDAREGRRAGTPGERASAEYIAAEFERMGLEPAGENGSWFQEFEVALPARDGGGSTLIAHQSSGPVLVDQTAAIVPLFCSTGEQVSGRAWFADYGIVNEDTGWDSYDSADLAGGIAVIVRGTPPDKALPEKSEEAESEEGVSKGHGWGNSGSIFHKVMTAKRHGAAGVVLVQHPSEKGADLLRFDPSQIGEAGIPCVMIGTEVAANLFGGWEQIVGVADLGGRTVMTFRDRGGEQSRETRKVPLTATKIREGGFNSLEQGLFDQDESPFLTLEIRADVVRENASASNVLARRRGAIPGRTVVVGAHFDHLGRGGEGSLAPNEQGEIHNGADDNASGTACVLELARLLSDQWIPDGDVVFALWSGEELGLLGSEHWMRNPTIELSDVHANINLDMVGRCDDGELQILGAGTSTAFAKWMAPAAEYSNLDLQVSLSGQGDGGSDHQTFLRREIPALHLFSGTHGDYHKPSDDTELVELDGMRRVVLLCLDLTTRIHQRPWIAFSEVAEERKAVERKRTSGSRFGSVPSYIADERGLVLDGTSPGGPAEAAGLLGGDILTEVGSVNIGTIHDFVYALQLYKPGDVVRVRFLRDGELEETRVTLTSNQVE